MRKLIIKSANGSVGDFKLDAQLSWTVKELKGHIYRHYPTHPPLASQKLIHGGKLLSDQSTLSEVIPSPLEGTGDHASDEPVVIHLVIYERSKSAPTSMSDRVPARPSLPVGTEGGGARNGQGTNGLSPIQERATPEQQRVPPVANPWLRHREAGGMVPNPMLAPQNLPVFGPGGVAVGGYPFPPAPQFYQQGPYDAAAYANRLQQWYYNSYYYRAPEGGAARGGAARREEPNPLDLPGNPLEANDLEPEDQDDVPVNGPGGLGMMPGGGGGLRHRDLVDYLYMFSMIGFLVLIAFLAGSLGRLLIFAAGVTFMLMNQAGFFSLQRRRQPTPPPLPRPQEDNPPPEQAGEGAETGREVTDGDQNGGDRSEGSYDPPPAPVLPPTQPPEEEQRAGLMATIFVFVTSFFTSLVPQQRPDLQVN